MEMSLWTQIFPEVNENEEADSCAENVLYRRERLPSIVVEPTEHNELESDNPRWPKPSSSEDAEETGGSADPTGSADDGEQQKDVTAEPGWGSNLTLISQAGNHDLKKAKKDK